MRRVLPLVLAGAFVGSCDPARAQWSGDPTQNLPVSAGAGDRGLSGLVTDDQGGLIALWTEAQPGIASDNFRAQRIDLSGTPRWAAQGEAVCFAPGRQRYIASLPDGVGGALLAWIDERDPASARVYAQRLGSDGASQWALDGIPVSVESVWAEQPALVSDGAGGMIVVWLERLPNDLGAIRAQRVSSDGTPSWAGGGVSIADSALLYQGPLRAASDGSGGVIMGAVRQRGEGTFGCFAWRVSCSGEPRWGNDGVLLAPWNGGPPQFVADGRGGAVVCWEAPTPTGEATRSQRLDSLGTPLWGDGGVQLRPPSTTVRIARIVTDGAAGAVLVWRGFADNVVGCQRVDSTGALRWGPAGLALSAPAPGFAIVPPRPSPDGSGGVLIAWEAHWPNDGDIHAQRVRGDGAVAWAPGGVPVCSAPGYQRNPYVLSDGAGGALVAWDDPRVAAPGVYAQRIGPEGSLGGTTLAGPVPARRRALSVRLASRAPARGSIEVECTMPGGPRVAVELFDLSGRRLDHVELGASGSPRTERVPLARGSGRLSPGVYVARIEQGGEHASSRVVLLD